MTETQTLTPLEATAAALAVAHANGQITEDAFLNFLQEIDVTPGTANRLAGIES